MNKNLIYLVLLFFVCSCSSKKRILSTESSSVKKTFYKSKNKLPSIGKVKPIPTDRNKDGDIIIISNNLTNKIINRALSFKGTKYKYGGTTKSGVDCSGLMYTSFKSGNINLPRTSILQSKEGIAVSKRNAKKGDLVFFKTGRSSKINHVGLVVSVDSRDVKFVHSSSSRGVMISSLREGYWSSAFSQLRRVVYNKNNNVKLTSNKTNTREYIVKKGDTLYAISRKYDGVTVSSIISLNKLKSTNLAPGMKLQIPLK